MTNHRGRIKGLGLAISSVIIFSGNCTIAQITTDNTLTTNSQVQSPNNNIINIQGGTQVGSNLFHSFQEFSVLQNQTAHFNNSQNIQNIITRVTGKSISNIQGRLKADHTANLFLINPNGIIFGPNASLDIGGSFIASTASSINFEDRTKFSATEPGQTSLLTVSVPIGLQFGVTVAPIHNRSQVSLQVQPNKTLALVGGAITLEGGNLTARSGRIELGSVGSNSLVHLLPTNRGWILGYGGVENFQDIQLIPRVDSTNKRYGSIVRNTGQTSGKGDDGIQIRGKTVALSGFVRIIANTGSNVNGQDITITSEKLIVQDGAAIRQDFINGGNGGKLQVNASESVELIGNVNQAGVFTGISSTPGAQGNGGYITITTKKLRILDGAALIAQSNGSIANSVFIPAQGNAGNITVNASELVEIAGYSANSTFMQPSLLSASIGNNTSAGIVTMTTGQLIVRDSAEINVDVNAPRSEDTSNFATPGQINITARSILLDNQGKIQAQSTSGQGGNMTLRVQDLLLMRRNSQISASAGTANAPGNGGNITINAPNALVVAAPLENNDITANAFSGSGGNIKIDATGIFGFVPRTREELEEELEKRGLTPDDPTKLDASQLETSDITAFSQQNRSLSGTIQINSPEVDPSKGLVELPVNIVDAQNLIAANCNPGGKLARGSFTVTGRGGIAASPREPLMSSDVIGADWLKLPSEGVNRTGDVQNGVIQKQGNRENITQKADFVNRPTEIVEAQGWVIDSNGNLVLVAQSPTVTPHSPALTSASCSAIEHIKLPRSCAEPHIGIEIVKSCHYWDIQQYRN